MLKCVELTVRAEHQGEGKLLTYFIVTTSSMGLWLLTHLLSHLTAGGGVAMSFFSSTGVCFKDDLEEPAALKTRIKLEDADMYKKRNVLRNLCGTKFKSL